MLQFKPYCLSQSAPNTFVFHCVSFPNWAPIQKLCCLGHSFSNTTEIQTRPSPQTDGPEIREIKGLQVLFCHSKLPRVLSRSLQCIQTLSLVICRHCDRPSSLCTSVLSVVRLHKPQFRNEQKLAAIALWPEISLWPRVSTWSFPAQRRLCAYANPGVAAQ